MTRVSPEALAAVREALRDAMPDDLLPDEHLDDVAETVAHRLADNLGGIILEPELRGLAYVNTLDGRPARELYLDAPEGQVWDGPLIQIDSADGWVEYSEPTS
jgi:hypothetical protein